MCVSALIGAGASILGGVMSSSAAGDAADAQSAAAADANALQKYMYDENVQRSQPFYESGLRNNAILDYLNGVGDMPTYDPALQEAVDAANALTVDTRITPTIYADQSSPSLPGNFRQPAGLSTPGRRRGETLNDVIRSQMPTTQTTYAVGDREFGTLDAANEYIESQIAAANEANATNFDYRGFEETPGYQFRVQQGQRGVDSGMAARGLGTSGAALKATERFRQGLAAQEFGDYYNRVAAGAGRGQTQANALNALGTNYASAVGANTMAAGQAQSSAYSNQGNIWGNVGTQLAGFAGQAFGGMSLGNNNLWQAGGLTAQSQLGPIY